MTCRIITVDGTPVRLQGDGSMTAEDAAAFIELVRAVRRAEASFPGRLERQRAARERYRRRLIRARGEGTDS